MKRMITLFLTLIFITMILLPVHADEVSQSDLYKGFYERAVCSVFQMQSKAINTEWPIREQQFYAERFAKSDAGHPSAVAIFSLTEAEADVLKSFTACNTWSGILETLNHSVNGQYSRAYPDLMDSIGIHQSSGISLPDGQTVYCLLLVYDYDIIAALFDPQRSIPQALSAQNRLRRA